MITFLKRASILFFVCLFAMGAAPSKKLADHPPVQKKKINEANGIPLALLSSLYEHVEESGVATEWPARHAVLLFHQSGAAFLRIRTGKEEKNDFDDLKHWKTYEAKFSYEHGILSIHFDSNEFTRSASFSLDLAADKVTFPFEIFSSQKGSSTWVRDDNRGRLLLKIICHLGLAIVQARQASRETTTVLLAQYLRLFVHSEGTPEVDVSPAPAIFSMTAFKFDKNVLALKLDDPFWLKTIDGLFSDCFYGASSRPSFFPCNSSVLICNQKECGCIIKNETFQAIPVETVFSGSCEREQISELISQYSNKRYVNGVFGWPGCYDEEMTFQTESVADKFTISFTIDSTGKVSEGGVIQSSRKNKELESDLLWRAERWIFPPPKNGGECKVNHSFVIKTTPAVLAPVKEEEVGRK